LYIDLVLYLLMMHGQTKIKFTHFMFRSFIF